MLGGSPEKGGCPLCQWGVMLGYVLEWEKNQGIEQCFEYTIFCVKREEMCACGCPHMCACVCVCMHMCVCMLRLSKRNPKSIKQNWRNRTACRRGNLQGEGQRCRSKASVSALGGWTWRFETCQYFPCWKHYVKKGEKTERYIIIEPSSVPRRWLRLRESNAFKWL